MEAVEAELRDFFTAFPPGNWPRVLPPLSRLITHAVAEYLGLQSRSKFAYCLYSGMNGFKIECCCLTRSTRVLSELCESNHVIVCLLSLFRWGTHLRTVTEAYPSQQSCRPLLSSRSAPGQLPRPASAALTQGSTRLPPADKQLRTPTRWPRSLFWLALNCTQLDWFGSASPLTYLRPSILPLNSFNSKLSISSLFPICLRFYSPPCTQMICYKFSMGSLSFKFFSKIQLPFHNCARNKQY